MENVTNLVFEWPTFLKHVAQADEGIEARMLYIYTAKSVLDEVPYLVFRVWFRSPAGLTMFVGDVRLGPVTVWQACFRLLLRASDLAVSRTLALKFSELPDAEQGWVAPEMVTR